MHCDNLQCGAPWFDAATVYGAELREMVEKAVAKFGHCHICPDGFDPTGQPYSVWTVPLPAGDENGIAHFAAEMGFPPPVA